MTTITLEQHMNEIKERLDRKESDLELNIFAEEIERARNVTIDTVRDELPKTVTEPYGKVEFFPEYDNPPGYEQWLELRKEGFVNQPMQGIKSASMGCWNICRPINERASWEVRESLIELPYKNSFFGKTFRIFDDEKVHYLMNIPKSNHLRNWVFGITKEDIELHKTIIQQRRSRSELQIYFAYVIGIANDTLREPTQEELKEFARKPMVRHVFGIDPPTEEEIKEELQRIHGISKRRDYVIDWVKPENLSYPMPRGVLYTYKDAKESGIFEDLEFGLLEERRRVIDPVLIGKYKGFRVPLCYWK